ncbi:hypothetical protein B566_EDAN005870 [Ephemera danica]|nr:hypothetical protein B566_EDAN005870 [Ephemera danica]
MSARYYYLSGMKIYYSWMWATTDTPFTYDAWAEYEPTSSSSQSKNCLSMKTQYLYDGSCDADQYFICESLCSDKQIVNDKEMDNTKELVVIEGRIYYFSSVEVNSITDGLNTCYDLGLSLVSFETEKELQDVHAYLVSTQTSGNQFWTSGVQMYLQWTWSSTGQFVNPWFWGFNEPPGSSSLQTFVYLQNGELYDTTYGNSIQIFFICEESSC